MNDNAQTELARVRAFAAEVAADLELEQPNKSDTLSKNDEPRGVKNQNVGVVGLQAFVCVAPDTTISEAFKRMKDAEIDFMFVCGEAGEVVGGFSQQDALTRVAAGESFDLSARVREFMSSEYASLTQDATLGEVVEKLNSSGARAIAITEGKRFVGAISDLDVITFLAESYPKTTMNLPPVAKQMMDTREGE